jgi:hypothetical protein
MDTQVKPGRKRVSDENAVLQLVVPRWLYNEVETSARTDMCSMSAIGRRALVRGLGLGAKDLAEV